MIIPVKIITFNEALKLGLTKRENIAAAGFVTGGKIGEPPIIMEKTLLKEDGTMELIFIHEDRKKELNERNELID
jgi:hypothetical protein